MAATVAPDHLAYRGVLGSFPTGVVVVTGHGRVAPPAGLSISSFTSVSLDPPLVSFCVAHTSTTWPRLRAASCWCVNVLGAGQHELCRRFATAGVERFKDCSWHPSPGGAPVLDGAVAWLECTPYAEHRAGDHVIVVARVREFGHRRDGSPLVLLRGEPGRFRAADSGPNGGTR
ncbi:flavin reductase family protein [Micromonospora aurantiaca]|uniref:flavin reductase family protein n=1 Tax=Micromonospora TaxID=1873 RepID=UPI0037AA6BCF